MSEPKLISPMLDNFVMGDPISEHNGVRCCPAMKKDSDEKFIVKIISVPASSTQLDALLLSGAYSTKESALSYFNTLSTSIADEVSILEKLSELEGFLPIDGCQIVDADNGAGYDVYLLSQYRKTLQRQMRRGGMTHLSALNLGLDLCAALAVARRMGYLYANLKPENVYMNNNQEYRIGDIGFLALDSLKYTSLPDRYRSAYTAPEITDAYSDLNTTIDVYALGLVLYQIFNDGNLPFNSETAPAEKFPAPAYADCEISEIILKACDPEPAARWQNPVELAQALVGYMQRNGAHDTPIVPVVAEAASVEDTDEETGVFEENRALNSLDAADHSDEDSAEDVEEEPITEESIYTEDSEGNLTFLEGQTDETTEAHNPADIDYDEVTSEVSDMLLQADDLIAHDTPDPVIPPEPIDVPVPPLVLPYEDENEESAPTEDVAPESKEDTESSEEADVEEGEKKPEESSQSDDSDACEAEDDPEDADTLLEKKKSGKGWIVTTILIFLVAALLIAGLFFYKNYILQTIDAIALEGGDVGELTVRVLTQADETDLTVICTDTYGNQHTSSVKDGKAYFNTLTPNSAYTIKITTTGLHQLTGNTTAAYTTPTVTEIIQFSAVTGAEDGSVVLSFTINGPDSEKWSVTYTTDSGTDERCTFTGHMVTIKGLTVGKEYQFTLSPVKQLFMTGNDTVVHIASALVNAQDLVVTSCINKTLTAQWSAPADTAVKSWTVRCYNETYNQTLIVTDPTATFEVPDDTAGYTVEVTAAGMSVSQQAVVSKNPVNVKDFNVDASVSGKLQLSWTPITTVPESGFVLSVSTDGSVAKLLPVTNGNSIAVSPVIPGCMYRFVLQTTDGSTVLGGTYTYTTEAAKDFSGYKVTASDMEFKMCLTPSKANWDRYDLSASDYTTSFTTTEKASFLVHLKRSYNTSSTKIETLFVIRDEKGIVVDTSTSTRTWTNMWWRNYCELDIPSIPKTPGKYTITTYFNGAFANRTAFTVTQ